MAGSKEASATTTAAEGSEPVETSASPSSSEWMYLDVSAQSNRYLRKLVGMTQEDRKAIVQKLSKPAHTVTEKDLSVVTPMTWLEELTAMFVLALVPGSGLLLPVLLILCYLVLGKLYAFLMIALYLGGLAIRAEFDIRAHTSFPALSLVRYFSYRQIYAELLEPNKPYIFVAPPHGVFPYGNVATVITFPVVMGYACRALAATGAVTLPIFKHLLKPIGLISASRESAIKALSEGHTLGISTGGVAEVFQTNSETGDEVVVLNCRKGLVKLALRTGADLVPCYCFGNTQCLSLWYDRAGVLSAISRKLGFALITFWGRFGLPIAYRVPILAVTGKHIPVTKTENPTQEQIDELHARLVREVHNCFEAHKVKYGWGHKSLVIV